MATTGCNSKVFVDLSEVVRVLCAVGFSIRHIDTSEQSDVTPTGIPGQEQRGGCRVVVTCTTSGLRAVLETVGEECGCSTHLTTAADTKMADTVIAPFSDSAAMMLRELLIKLTKHANEHDKTASTRNADLPQSTSRCNELQELMHESHLQVHVGLGSRSTLSVSLDNLSTPSDLGHSLQKDKFHKWYTRPSAEYTEDGNVRLSEALIRIYHTTQVYNQEREISSCPPSPAVRDDNYLGVPQFPSMETLASPKISETSCGSLCPSSDTRREENIEKKLKLAAACIQEVLAMHRRDSIATRTTSSLFKVPSVPGSKRKTTTNFPQGESHKCASEKSIKPRPLTPLPAKKAKALVSDKSSILRTPNPSSKGRTNLGISRR